MTCTLHGASCLSLTLPVLARAHYARPVQDTARLKSWDENLAQQPVALTFCHSGNNRNGTWKEWTCSLQIMAYPKGHQFT